MRFEVGDYAVLFSTKSASLAQSLSDYFSHTLGFISISALCTGLHRVGILIYISG